MEKMSNATRVDSIDLIIYLSDISMSWGPRKYDQLLLSFLYLVVCFFHLVFSLPLKRFHQTPSRFRWSDRKRCIRGASALHYLALVVPGKGK